MNTILGRRELDQLQNNTKVVISAATEGIPLYSYANPANLFSDVHIHFTLQ
jgi:hypothetical protein